MITIRSTSPNPPLGKYPHERLCPHVGRAPINSRIRTTMRIVPSTTSFHFINPTQRWLTKKWARGV
jgi:hypothetical protein